MGGCDGGDGDGDGADDGYAYGDDGRCCASLYLPFEVGGVATSRLQFFHDFDTHVPRWRV